MSGAGFVEWRPTEVDSTIRTGASWDVDRDGDNDLDLISIGWRNPKLSVYEQK